MKKPVQDGQGTAPSIAEVAYQDVWDAVKEFSAYFPLNPAKRGKFKGFKDGVKVVSTHDGKPFTPEIAYAHLSGFFAPKPGKADLRTSIAAWGQLPGCINDAGQHVTNVICLDLDAKDFSNLEPDAMDNARLSLQAVASDYGAVLYSETSISGKGEHCWLFLKEAVSLSNARAIGRGLARLAGLHNANTLEVNPKGDGLESNWITMPYARAMTDSENPGLGLTYLVTPDGEPVPVTELSEWITRADNNRLMDLLAEGLSETEDATPSPTGTTTADLKPEALQLLMAAAGTPPETFARHASLNAFLNLARRCEGLEEMADHLKSEAVFKAWVTDDSRTRETWAKEIDRWLIAAKHQKKERGIPFLVQQGFELPDLPKKPKSKGLPTDRPNKEGGKSDEGESKKRELESDEIQVNRHISETVAEVASRLKELTVNNNPRVFSRGDGMLVEMRPDLKLIEITTPTSLKAFLHELFKPVAVRDGADPTASAFNENHVNLLLRRAVDFPQIHAVSEIPLMLPDGTILETPGYHEESGYFLNTRGITLEHIPLDAARDLFIETFNEFGYQAPRAGFTATMALIFQPFLAPLIDDISPLIAILGARRSGSGSGKGFLVDCVYRIHKGRPYSHSGSMPDSNEELKKVLFASLLAGATHIIFDDVDHLKHRELMAATTSRTYEGRILGYSQVREVSANVSWIVTGNAPDIHRDFYRRMIPIYMGTGRARAWEQTYSNPNIHHEILEKRSLYLSAIVSILKSWRDAGMPLSTDTLSGYTRWSAVIGGVLEFMALPYLAEARDGLDDLVEVDNSDLDALVWHWLQNPELKHEKLKGRDLQRLAKSYDLFAQMFKEPDNSSSSTDAAALGKYLKPFANDIFHDHFLRRELDTDSKTWRYFLEPIKLTKSTLKDVFVNSEAQQIWSSTPPYDPRKNENGRVTGVLRGSTASDKLAKKEKAATDESVANPLEWGDL